MIFRLMLCATKKYYTDFAASCATTSASLPNFSLPRQNRSGSRTQIIRSPSLNELFDRFAVIDFIFLNAARKLRKLGVAGEP